MQPPDHSRLIKSALWMGTLSTAMLCGCVYLRKEYQKVVDLKIDQELASVAGIFHEDERYYQYRSNVAEKYDTGKRLGLDVEVTGCNKQPGLYSIAVDNRNIRLSARYCTLPLLRRACLRDWNKEWKTHTRMTVDQVYHTVEISVKCGHIDNKLGMEFNMDDGEEELDEEEEHVMTKTNPPMKLDEMLTHVSGKTKNMVYACIFSSLFASIGLFIFEKLIFVARPPRRQLFQRATTAGTTVNAEKREEEWEMMHENDVETEEGFVAM